MVRTIALAVQQNVAGPRGDDDVADVETGGHLDPGADFFRHGDDRGVAGTRWAAARSTALCRAGVSASG